MKYSFFILVLICSFISCSSDCVTCKMENPDFVLIEEEYCDDGKVNYTDQNGKIITFDELILWKESIGLCANSSSLILIF